MNSPNFMQIPINRPINAVHNNQRDGYMQQNVYKGNVAYYPNGLQGNTPSTVEPEDGGYIDYPEKVSGVKQRGKSAKFFDYYSQAQLYYNSLTEAEKQQMIDGLRFEIGKSKSLDVRRRMIDVINHVDNNLARRIAKSINVPLPDKIVENQNKTTTGISIEEYPKPRNIRTRTVAILTAPGTDVHEAQAMYDYLAKEGAYIEFIGIALGDQDGLNITNTYLHTSSVLYDAVYIPGGKAGIRMLTKNVSEFPYDEPKMFVLDAYRHCKPIAASGEGINFLKTSVSDDVVDKDGIITGKSGSALQEDFKEAIIQMRFWSRLPLDKDVWSNKYYCNLDMFSWMHRLFFVYSFIWFYLLSVLALATKRRASIALCIKFTPTVTLSVTSVEIFRRCSRRALHNARRCSKSFWVIRVNDAYLLYVACKRKRWTKRF